MVARIGVVQGMGLATRQGLGLGLEVGEGLVAGGGAASGARAWAGAGAGDFFVRCFRHRPDSLTVPREKFSGPAGQFRLGGGTD